MALPPAADVLPALAPGAETNAIDIITGDLEVDLNGPASFSDRLVLRQGDRQFGADGGTYDRTTGEFAARGNVEFLDQATWVRGGNAVYNSTTGRFSIEDAEYDLFVVPARGSADRITVKDGEQLSLTDVTYTSCARGDDDWLLHAGSLEVDRTTGTATARNARLEFMGVPILYTPYLTYPIDNRRKSGLLLPEVGSSEQRGAEYSQPYYFNLAPNYDATFTPHYMSDRGLQAQGEFRYLKDGTSGIATAAFLPNDKVTGENRTQLTWFNQSLLPAGWRATVDATDVSDDSYYEDLTSGLANTSQVVLTRSVAFERFSETWSALLEVEDYEMLDPALTPEEEPYKEVPRLAVHGRWPDAGLGLALGIGSEVTYFDRSSGVTGLRAHVQPEVSRPVDLGPLLLEPYVGLDYTVYSLNHVAPDGNDAPSAARCPSTASTCAHCWTGSGATAASGCRRSSPGSSTCYVPYKDQNEFPVFDTIQPDFSLVQLFRRNRYVGLDRFGDTNQVNLGLTTRLIRAEGRLPVPHRDDRRDAVLQLPGRRAARRGAE